MAPNSLIETLRLRFVVCVIEAIEFMIAIAQKNRGLDFKAPMPACACSEQ